VSKTLAELDQILTDFEKDHWVAPASRKGKIRHILLHMTKLVGKLGTVVEKWEHDLVVDEDVLITDVIPDLMIYALMLNREEGVDLEKVFLERLEINKKKVGGWKDSDLIKELPQL
jgi:hypothetical protein